MQTVNVDAYKITGLHDKIPIVYEKKILASFVVHITELRFHEKGFKLITILIVSCCASFSHNIIITKCTIQK
uniref:Uncharacterized protein n=1 Tax=Populus trichocarpa TaxID=3694 RepID=A0A2K1ZM74_POPTR